MVPKHSAVLHSNNYSFQKMGQPWKYPKLHISYHVGCYYSKLKRTKESIQCACVANVPRFHHPCARELRTNSPTTKPGVVFLQSFPGYREDPCNRGEELTCTFNQTSISELPPTHVNSHLYPLKQQASPTKPHKLRAISRQKHADKRIRTQLLTADPPHQAGEQCFVFAALQHTADAFSRFKVVQN